MGSVAAVLQLYLKSLVQVKSPILLVPNSWCFENFCNCTGDQPQELTAKWKFGAPRLVSEPQGHQLNFPSSPMTHPTHNSNSCDDTCQTTSTMEQQLNSLSTVVNSISTRLTTQESCLDDYTSQFTESQALQRQNISEQQNTASLVQQLIGEIRQLQSTRSTTPSPPDSRISIPVSTPYQPPHTHMPDSTRSHTIHSPHQDYSRRDDEWLQQDSFQHWQPPRSELPKFDGTNLLDWLEDYDYYFHTSHTPEFYKLQMVIPQLVREAQE
jgi:hypothetical protein